MALKAYTLDLALQTSSEFAIGNTIPNVAGIATDGKGFIPTKNSVNKTITLSKGFGKFGGRLFELTEQTVYSWDAGSKDADAYLVIDLTKQNSFTGTIEDGTYTFVDNQSSIVVSSTQPEPSANTLVYKLDGNYQTENATEPVNLFFNSEFENSGEGWGLIDGFGSFTIGNGGDEINGHNLLNMKLNGTYYRLGNTTLHPTGGNVSYSISTLGNSGTATNLYFIVDEFDVNKSKIKTTPFLISGSATWSYAKFSFITQSQTRFVRVSYQANGAVDQYAYAAAPMWNTGKIPLTYVRGSEMQAIPDQKIYTRTVGTTNDLQITYTRVSNLVTGRYKARFAATFPLGANDGYKSTSGYPVNAIVGSGVNAYFTTDNNFVVDKASEGNFVFITNDPFPV